MKYRHFISVAAPAELEVTPSIQATDSGQHVSSSARRVHRLTPVLQFVSDVSPEVVSLLQQVALRAHLRGVAGNAVCEAVYSAALGIRLQPCIHVQEIYATDLPSYPGQRTVTTLLIVDLETI